MKFLTVLVLLAQTMHSADNLEQRRQALKKALADEWEYELRESPEAASSYGDYRYNDKWSDISLAHVPQRRKDAKAFLDRFEAIDTMGLTEQEQISKRLIVEKYKDTLEDIGFKNYLMPVDQFNGIQIMLPQIVSAIPLDSVKHNEDRLARLWRIPCVLQDTKLVMKQG